MLATSKHGVVDYIITNKTNNSESVEIFLERMIKTLKESVKTAKYYEDEKVCLIWYNVPIHKAKIVQNAIWKTKLKILFLPPYHPWMNPVEYCFRSLKVQFYRRTFISV